MFGFRAGWALPLAALGLAGCANLDSVTSGHCGDGVVDSNEDCDQEGSACGAPGSVNACRWLCAATTSSDGAGGTSTLSCPAGGWLCGVDGVCRQAASPATWTANAQIPDDNARQLLVSDFDSDGVDDIVTVSPSTVALHFSETDRTSTAGPSIVAAAPRPSVGVLPGEAKGNGYESGAPSLTVDLNQGVGVFTGEIDRTLSPVVFAAITYATGPATQRDRVVPFLIPKLAMTDQPESVTALYIYNGQRALAIIPPDATPNPIGTWGDTLAGPAAVARLSAINPCDQIAVPLNRTTGGHVKIYDGCGLPNQAGYDISLPGFVCTSCAGPVLHAVDVDNDGNLDLMITGDGAPPPLYVAYANGLGGFSDTPGGLANGKASASLTLNGTNGMALTRGSPLAVGDLNGDCVLDFVDSNNIWLSTYTITKSSCTANVVKNPATYVSYNSADPAAPWTQAAIADMNADGRLDVVASSSQAAGVTIYRGTDTLLLDPYEIVTSTAVKSFSIGDFDGDLVQDVAIAGAGEADASNVTQDPISISFGATSGPPSDANVVGVVPNVGEVVALLEEPISPDGVSNAGVVAYRDNADGSHNADLYLFIGNTAREVNTPYLLIQNGLAMQSGAVVAGMNTGIDIPRRTLVGSFTGRAGLGDMAVVGKPVLGCTMATSCPSRLWVLPTTEYGSVAPAGSTGDKSQVYPLPSLLGGANDVLLANYGPPAGSTFDTIAIAASGDDPTTMKQSTVLFLTGDGKGSYQDIEQVFQLDAFELADPTGLGTLLIADVDGDGNRDLVLASSTSGLAVVLAHAGSTPFDTSSKVATIPYATFTGKACAANQPGAKSQPAIGVTALPASGKAQPLLVVVPQGTMQVTWDAAKSTFTDPACLANFSGGVAVATGDFDGDRILDVVVSQGDTLDVYFGDAVAAGAAGAVDGGAQ